MAGAREGGNMGPRQQPRKRLAIQQAAEQVWHRYELAQLAYNQILADEKLAASRSGVFAQYRRTRSAYLRQHIFRPRPTCKLPPTPPPSPAENKPGLEPEPELDIPLSPSKPFTRHVRFSTDFPDNSSRAQHFYHRKSWKYAPGRWADASGEGFWNTSDPYEETKPVLFLGFGEKEEDSDEEMDDAPDMVEDDEEKVEDDDSDLEEMTPEQLAERTRIIEARLMALRKADAERGRTRLH